MVTATVYLILGRMAQHDKYRLDSNGFGIGQSDSHSLYENYNLPTVRTLLYDSLSSVLVQHNLRIIPVVRTLYSPLKHLVYALHIHRGPPQRHISYAGSPIIYTARGSSKRCPYAYLACFTRN